MAKNPCKPPVFARTGLFAGLVAALFATWSSPSEADDQKDGYIEARDLALAGKVDEAIKILATAIKQDGPSYQTALLHGQLLDDRKRYDEAVAAYSQAITLEPKRADLFQRRGISRYFAGRFKESIADFDVYLEAQPKRRPFHWQRGIACYNAGMFKEGREQFELHQTVNAHDVENAVWHFLCVARLAGLKEAREKLIPIKGDSRVPMAEVHRLFAGADNGKAVLAAAEAVTDPGKKRNALCYAHLYLGLFAEAKEDWKTAAEHLQLATDTYGMPHYMGEVARICRDQAKNKVKKKAQ